MRVGNEAKVAVRISCLDNISGRKLPELSEDTFVLFVFFIALTGACLFVFLLVCFLMMRRERAQDSTSFKSEGDLMLECDQEDNTKALAKLNEIIDVVPSDWSLMHNLVILILRGAGAQAGFLAVTTLLGNTSAVERNLVLGIILAIYWITSALTLFQFTLVNYLEACIYKSFLQCGVVIEYNRVGFDVSSRRVPVHPLLVLQCLVAGVMSFQMLCIFFRQEQLFSWTGLKAFFSWAACSVPLAGVCAHIRSVQDMNEQYFLPATKYATTSSAAPPWLLRVSSERAYRCLMSSEAPVTWSSMRAFAESAAEEQKTEPPEAASDHDSSPWQHFKHSFGKNFRLGFQDWPWMISYLFPRGSYVSAAHAIMLTGAPLVIIGLLCCLLVKFSRTAPIMEYGPKLTTPGIGIQEGGAHTFYVAAEVQGIVGFMMVPDASTIREAKWCLDSEQDVGTAGGVWKSLQREYQQDTKMQGAAAAVWSGSVDIGKAAADLHIAAVGAYTKVISFKVEPVQPYFVWKGMVDCGDRSGQLKLTYNPRNASKEHNELTEVVIPAGDGCKLIQDSDAMHHQLVASNGSLLDDWRPGIWDVEFDPPANFTENVSVVEATISAANTSHQRRHKFAVRQVEPYVDLVVDPDIDTDGVKDSDIISPGSWTCTLDSCFRELKCDETLSQVHLALKHHPHTTIRWLREQEHGCGQVDKDTIVFTDLHGQLPCTIKFQVTTGAHGSYSGNLTKEMMFSLSVIRSNIIEGRVLDLNDKIRQYEIGGLQPARNIDKIKELQEKLLKRAKDHQMQAPKNKSVHVLVGATGKGKTSLCFWLTGNGEKCTPSASVHSATSKLTYVTGRAFGDSAQGELTVIDTPGLDDTKGGDENASRALKGLRNMTSSVNSIDWVQDYSDVRLPQAFVNGFKALRKIFGIGLYEVLAIILNRVRVPAQGNASSMQDMAEEWKKRFMRWMMECEKSVFDGSDEYEINSTSMQTYFTEVAEAIQRVQVFPVDLAPATFRSMSEPYVSKLWPYRFMPGQSLPQLYEKDSTRPSLPIDRGPPRLGFGRATKKRMRWYA